MRHSLRIATRAVALGAVVASGAAGVAGAQTASPVVGHLYTDLNTTHVNKIAGFDRHADGALTPIAGSPFTVGGAGTGKGIGSQGALQFADNGSLLLAVDPGSNQISALKVASDGSLTKVGVVSSGGNTPASLAVAGNQVYVANQGPKHANYTGFTLNSSGVLTVEPGTTAKLAADADPGDVLINSTGTRLIGTEVGPSVIDSFTIGRGGKLTKAKGSPIAAQGPGPFGSAFDPADPNRVFISNAHGGDNAGTVSAYNDGAGGVLSSIGAGPFNDLQTAPCWVALNRAGTELFAVNTAVPSVSRYSVASNGALKLTDSAKFLAGAKGPEDAGLAPNGKTLWVADTASDSLSAFSTTGRHLAAAKATAKLPKGAAPFGIAVN
jgi:6-phosphogluconolactonase